MKNMDEQTAQQPKISPSYMAAPMHQYGSSILFLTNPQDEIFKMEACLRNVSVEDDGKVIHHGPPLMNENGISAVIGQVQSVVNQNTNMSDLDKNDINSHIMYLTNYLARQLMINRKKYGINDPNDRDIIVQQAVQIAHITLKRALTGGERRFWKGSVQEIETRVNQQKQGIGSILNPWKKTT